MPPQNVEPRPNTDRFLQPAPIIPPTTPDPQAPILETPTPTPTQPAPPIRIQVQKVEVTGNTILSNEISAITKPLEGKEVTIQELGKVADSITQLYVERGYITSRAVLPDQKITDGVVRILVIEGKLEKIEIEGNRRLNSSYIRSRVRLGVEQPLNSAKLEDQLRLLRFNPLFKNVEASLRPGNQQGQSILVVRVTEASPFTGSSLVIDNNSPPSIGSERFGGNFFARNVSGIGDTFFASYFRSTTGGSNVLDFSYTVPINAMDGTLQLRAAPNYYRVTEEEFRDLDIRGNSELYEFSYRQPLIRSPREELALSIGFTYRRGQTFLDDEPFPFGFGPDEEGRTRTSVIGFGQDYVRRDVQGATALRSLFSFGIDAFDATTNPEPIPDGRFFSWLGQVQRVQRISNNNVLIIQGDLQLTPNSLLPSQQFVIGGGQSIRGYRQNLRSGDNGFRVSIEDRIILSRDKGGREIFQLAPFVDLGTVWNHPDNPNAIPSRRFLAGAGLGVLWEPIPGLNLRIDYGIPLSYVRDRGDNIQDRGLYFQLFYRF
ncbi:ShlB/FhaC/HecB family hemolysin secretion/activation protein [Floridanema evergladense]|uniref:ShlB/FhaC/HecB family hemolysin secretion/activation protein n=1 Tax=Floridaenema evergladense BLCC-F167 TaxID=3153639 RepID=A0ABV4WQA7_9CYAN